MQTFDIPPFLSKVLQSNRTMALIPHVHKKSVGSLLCDQFLRDNDQLWKQRIKATKGMETCSFEELREKIFSTAYSENLHQDQSFTPMYWVRHDFVTGIDVVNMVMDRGYAYAMSFVPHSPTICALNQNSGSVQVTHTTTGSSTAYTEKYNGSSSFGQTLLSQSATNIIPAFVDIFNDCYHGRFDPRSGKSTFRLNMGTRVLRVSRKKFKIKREESASSKPKFLNTLTRSGNFPGASERTQLDVSNGRCKEEIGDDNCDRSIDTANELQVGNKKLTFNIVDPKKTVDGVSDQQIVICTGPFFDQASLEYALTKFIGSSDTRWALGMEED